MNELIYAGKEIEDIVRAKYPQAVIKDASDVIHTERFELCIEGVEDDEFYPFAIRSGFAKCCLGFELVLQSLGFKKNVKRKENKVKLERWLELANT